MSKRAPIEQAVINQRFVEAYLGECNLVASAAAKAAGFGGKKHSLETSGMRMLRRQDVKDLILERMERASVTPERVLLVLEKHLGGDMKDIVTINGDGDPQFDWQKALDNKKTGLIKKLRIKKRRFDGDENGDGAYTETEIGAELYSAKDAADSLSKIYGMIIDRKEIIRRKITTPASDDVLIEKLRLVGTPEERWPPGVLARYRKKVASTVVSAPKGKS